MSFIKAHELGLYAPKSNEALKSKTEAQKYITEAIFSYKQLFYGLRLVAWRSRDKRITFYDALSNGELEQFKIAPGHRQPDGSYSKTEWDYDHLNAYMWNRFRERFDSACNLESLRKLKSLKDIKQATQELLEFALLNWGEQILAQDLMDEATRIESISKGVTSCQLEYHNITISGKFSDSERTLVLKAQGLPEVTVKQTKGTSSWKGGIHLQSFEETMTMNSKTAELFGQMLDLAARLNVGINEFMANPEGFLGLESAQAHKRNLEMIKDKLLMINEDAYEKRKAESEKLDTRRLNEGVDTNEKMVDAPSATAETVPDQPANVPDQPAKQPAKSSSRKQQREMEAAAWLAQHGSELEEELDPKLGLAVIDTPELLIKAESEDLPM